MQGRGIPQWVRDWCGDARELVGHVDDIENSCEIAERLFESKQGAFSAGFTVGAALADIERRGVEAVQADEDEQRAESLQLLTDIQRRALGTG